MVLQNHPQNMNSFYMNKYMPRTKQLQKNPASWFIEPHVFSRRRKAKKIGETATFVCNECKKLNKYVTAKAKKIGENENDFELLKYPSLDEHITHSTAHLKTKFFESMYEKIKNNPSADMPKLYEKIV